MRRISKVAPGWWDYTTLDQDLLDEAAALAIDDLPGLSREGFEVRFFDTREEFFLAEALEYVSAWRQATPQRPAGICGPIGPSEQLPLVARLVNELELDLAHAHFWGMDEWAVDGEPVGLDHPLSLAKADMDLCFDRIRPELRMPSSNIHFPAPSTSEYERSWKEARCVIMQGGQGEVKHWAFNDPPKREGRYADNPPKPEEYLALGTRVVDLHPITMMQETRVAASGRLQDVPTQGISVGPLQTWRAEKISIWHPGDDDSPFGLRLTTLMISRKIADTSVPMSLMGLHPNVCFSFLRPAMRESALEMR